MSLKLSRPLAAVTLDDILSDSTCDPISLRDFESFLIHKQHSVEYLRFVVWYRSYASRFQSLTLEQQSPSPAVSAYDEGGDLDGKLPSPARLARFVSQASSVPAWSGVSSRESTSRSTASSSQSYAKDQPFRAECALVAHTFLGSHAPPCPMALNIPSDLLDATLAHLSQTTHPSVFHPVYQLSYEMLQTSSLPFFLAEATPNINREKQLYWWLYGAFTFLLGWAVTIGCLFIYKNENERQKSVSLEQRAWRLWAVPLLSLGGMQMYSAYRGFCSEVWGRGATQLRPWELIAPPLEQRATNSVQESFPRLPVKGEHCESTHAPSSISSSSQNGDKKSLDAVLQADVSSAHYDDFDLDLESPGPVVVPPSLQNINQTKQRPPPIIISGHHDHWDSPTPSVLTSPPSLVPMPPSTDRSTRARIFGPERVVVDPRVRAVHRRVMRDILIAGFVWSTVWTVVILCLPWTG